MTPPISQARGVGVVTKGGDTKTMTITMISTTLMVLEGAVIVATEMVVTDTVHNRPCDMIPLRNTMTLIVQEDGPKLGAETHHRADLTAGMTSIHRAECTTTTETVR